MRAAGKTLVKFEAIILDKIEKFINLGLNFKFIAK